MAKRSEQNAHPSEQAQAEHDTQPHVEKAETTHALTRRSFVKTAAAVAATAAVGGSTLSGCRSEAGDQFFRGERTITDQWGRELTIPTAENIERVYFTGPSGMIMVYTLKPEVMVGSSFRFTTQELEYLLPEVADLEYLGSTSAGAEIDRESLLVKDVQVIFSVSGTTFTEANASEAENLQSQTNIPVICVDGSFDKIADAYRFVGDILGVEEHAEEIATYLENIYNNVTEALADVADEDRVSLYYAEGPLGLQSEPDISQHALTFEVAKAKNVAAIELSSGIGMTNVSLEQVLLWDPEVIVAWDDVIRGGGDEIIRFEENWQNISAVKNGRVYTMPNAPFAWCDRPPAMNRFIGIQWVANMLYPDLYDVDMVEVTKDFYQTMFWIEITDDQAKELLGYSYPPYGTPGAPTRDDWVEPGANPNAGSEITTGRAQGADY